LVIQTHGTDLQDGFLCDAGAEGYPSYAPQPLAASGIMYLIRNVPQHDPVPEEKKYPAGLPGGLGEVEFQRDVWDSAVRELSAQGLINPDMVGISGFSRKGWYVEYILSHSTIRYRAASLTDNAQYSLGEYWLYDSEEHRQGYDAMYGGPPYGNTLANWMKYSASFNLDKMRTPILFEEMGYGVGYDGGRSIPINLAMKFESFHGLRGLRRPVDLYYYPREGHEAEDPRARLSNLQRNVDWYRFWLQGYERSDYSDTLQYPRWRKLRQMQPK
jgi:hypothetical protein